MIRCGIRRFSGCRPLCRVFHKAAINASGQLPSGHDGIVPVGSAKAAKEISSIYHVVYSRITGDSDSVFICVTGAMIYKPANDHAAHNGFIQRYSIGICVPGASDNCVFVAVRVHGNDCSAGDRAFHRRTV